VAQFKVGQGSEGQAGGLRRSPAPARLAPAHQAAPKPVNRMIQALKTVGRGGAAPKVEADPEGWEEF